MAEGKHAIDSPGMPKSAEMPPEVLESITIRRKQVVILST